MVFTLPGQLVIAHAGERVQRVSNVSSAAETQFGGLFYGDCNVLSVVGNRIEVNAPELGQVAQRIEVEVCSVAHTIVARNGGRP
jgi:hypothetical protein